MLPPLLLVIRRLECTGVVCSGVGIVVDEEEAGEVSTNTLLFMAAVIVSQLLFDVGNGILRSESSWRNEELRAYLALRGDLACEVLGLAISSSTDGAT